MRQYNRTMPRPSNSATCLPSPSIKPAQVGQTCCTVGCSRVYTVIYVQIRRVSLHTYSTYTSTLCLQFTVVSFSSLRVQDHPEDVRWPQRPFSGSTNSPPFDHPQKVPGPELGLSFFRLDKPKRNERTMKSFSPMLSLHPHCSPRPSHWAPGRDHLELRSFTRLRGGGGQERRGPGRPGGAVTKAGRILVGESSKVGTSPGILLLFFTGRPVFRLFRSDGL